MRGQEWSGILRRSWLHNLEVDSKTKNRAQPKGRALFPHPSSTRAHSVRTNLSPKDSPMLEGFLPSQNHPEEKNPKLKSFLCSPFSRPNRGISLC